MSVERFFSASESQQRLRAGPLARAIDGFAAWLAIEGYACCSAAEKLRFVGNLSRWLEREELGVEALDEQRVEAFLLARGSNSGRRGEATTGQQLLCYLRSSGVIPAAVSRPCSDTPIERIERTYERFLINERGVSPATVTNYLPTVRAFLAEHFGSREVALETLGVRDANQFVLRQARRLSRSRAKLVVTVLRSFLRHLYQRGDIHVDLSSALAPVMHWRLSGLPKALAPEQVESMLDSCDRGTAIGHRIQVKKETSRRRKFGSWRRVAAGLRSSRRVADTDTGIVDRVGTGVLGPDAGESVASRRVASRHVTLPPLPPGPWPPGAMPSTCASARRPPGAAPRSWRACAYRPFGRLLPAASGCRGHVALDRLDRALYGNELALESALRCATRPGFHSSTLLTLSFSTNRPHHSAAVPGTQQQAETPPDAAQPERFLSIRAPWHDGPDYVLRLPLAPPFAPAPEDHDSLPARPRTSAPTMRSLFGLPPFRQRFKNRRHQRSNCLLLGLQMFNLRCCLSFLKHEVPFRPCNTTNHPYQRFRRPSV